MGNKSGIRKAKLFSFSEPIPDFPKNLGVSALAVGVYKMNAKPEIRDAILVQKMNYWLLRARHGPIGGCSKSKGKKNFWALLRRYPILAGKHGLRETDVF